MKVQKQLFLATLLATTTGCLFGPGRKDVFVEGRENDTLIVIDLTDSPTSADSNQKKLDSIAALKKGQLTRKRVVIPMARHSYGHGFGQFQYVAQNMVLRVNRSLVSRTLTADPFSGERPVDEALETQTMDGIHEAIGVTFSGHIAEGDEALYLYSYGLVPWDYEYDPNHKNAAAPALLTDNSEVEKLIGFNSLEKLLYMCGYIDRAKNRVDYVTYNFQAKPLAMVLDEELSTFYQARLQELIGVVGLNEFNANKAQIFARIEQDAIVFYKSRGITLTGAGNQGGAIYENQAVQNAIYKRFDTIKDFEIALADEQALQIALQREVDQARADRDAAIPFLASYPAMRQQLVIDLMTIRRQRTEILQAGWDGASPPTVLEIGGSAQTLISIK